MSTSSEVIRLESRADPATVEGEAETSGTRRASVSGSGRLEKVGRYIPLEPIGRGGMGVVYTAYDPKLDRKVALKLLRKASGDRKRTHARRARMIREAQALAKLSHPNVITVHDVDTHRDRLYIAMEYVEGKTIAQWLRLKKRTWREVVDVFIHAGRGLAAAHDAGIIHRDFKPGNVLIGQDGRVRVLDFGLAKTAEDSDLIPVDTDPRETGELRDARSEVLDHLEPGTDLKLTQAGRAVGTPAYMAPEQFLAQHVGPHTDQFSFGAALYEALYGRLPFGTAARLSDLIDSVTDGKVREPPREAGVPGWVQRVVLRALEKDPDARFPSMNALLAELGRDPARRRRLWLAAGVSAVLAAGGSALAFGALASGEEERCTGASDRLAEFWNDDRRAAVHDAFAATGAPFASHAYERVSDTLDTIGQDWVSAHTEVCEATNVRGEQSAALMDHRIACLDRARNEIDALVSIFEAPDREVVEKSIAAVLSVGDVTRCVTVKPGEREAPPDDPAVRDAMNAVERELARTPALRSAGKYADALTVASAAATEARGVGREGLMANALLEHARALRVNRRGEDAARVLDETIRLASASGLDHVEAEAWIYLLLVRGIMLDQTEGALAVELSADLAIERADQPLELRALLAQNLAAVHAGARDFRAALPYSRQAVELLTEKFGPDHLATATARHDLSTVLGGLGEHAEASRELRIAARQLEDSFGRYHPKVGSAVFNLGSLLWLQDEAEAARDEYLAALEIYRKVQPEKHLSLTFPLIGLAQAERFTRPASAVERLEEALEILHANGDRPAFRLGMVHRLLGSIHLELGRRLLTEERQTEAREALDAARASLQRAVTAFESTRSQSTVPQGRAERLQCETELAAGDYPAAIEHCEVALRLLSSPEADEARDAALTLAALAMARAKGGPLDDASVIMLHGSADWLENLDTATAAEAWAKLATGLARSPGQDAAVREAIARAEAHRDELEGRAVLAELRRLKGMP